MIGLLDQALSATANSDGGAESVSTSCLSAAGCVSVVVQADSANIDTQSKAVAKGLALVLRVKGIPTSNESVQRMGNLNEGGLLLFTFLLLDKKNPPNPKVWWI